MAATGDALRQILDSSYPLWGEGLSRRGYEQYNVAQLATRWGRERLTRVALVERGRVLSSAKRYALDLSIDGKPVRTLGIGAVFTPPGLRGRGHARALLTRLLEQAREEGFAASLLFSEIGAAYYKGLGFTVVPRDTLKMAIARRPGAPGIVMRGGDARDIPLMSEMHDDLAARYRLTLRRAPEWIEYTLARKRLLSGFVAAGDREVLFFVVEEGGRAVAYAVVVATPDGWALEECGDRDPSGARVGAILQTLLAREPSSRGPVIWGWLPDGWLPPQLSIVARGAAEQVMMIRPLANEGRIDPPLQAASVHYWHSDVF
ncbi:MAG TPA: GNAT family N-acetyltransferase [Vicinamibacterales bacterium]|nr:GNAT family N-acetyltransferase [Vicinamibacterales bacterium]